MLIVSFDTNGKPTSVHFNRGSKLDPAWVSLPFEAITKSFKPKTELDYQLLAEAKALPEWATLDLSDRAPDPSIPDPISKEPGYISRTERGMPGGVATLDVSDGKLSKREMPLQTAVEVLYKAPANSIIGEPTNQQSALDMVLAKLAEHEAKVSLLLASAKTPVIQDALNNTDGVRLNVHTPNIYKGQKWVEEVGVWTITGNQVKSNGTAGSLARIESTLANCIVECDVTLADVAVQQTLILRFNPINKSHLRAGFLKSSGGSKFVIYEVVTNASLRASTAATVILGQPYRFKVVCQSDLITFYFADIPILSWSTTLNMDQTSHGIYSSTSIGTIFNNFLVTSF